MIPLGKGGIPNRVRRPCRYSPATLAVPSFTACPSVYIARPRPPSSTCTLDFSARRSLSYSTAPAALLPAPPSLFHLSCAKPSASRIFCLSFPTRDGAFLVPRCFVPSDAWSMPVSDGFVVLAAMLLASACRSISCLSNRTVSIPLCYFAQSRGMMDVLVSLEVLHPPKLCFSPMNAMIFLSATKSPSSVPAKSLGTQPSV